MNNISIVIPCYNEAENIREFYQRLSTLANELDMYEFEFIFVNDGSLDDTAEMLNGLADEDYRVKVLHFARNHGHQSAITAGMDFAFGDVVVTIDADLQDPPEFVSQLIEKIGEGNDIVHAQRRSRSGESRFKLFTAWGFYKLMKKLTNKDLVENSGDFRAFTRRVLKTVQAFREKHRFMRGMFASAGFRQCTIQYDRDPRYAGITKYSFGKMIKLALNAVLSFSSAPIHFIMWLSFLLWFISLAYLAKALIEHFIFKTTVEGWTSIIILMMFFTGIIIFCLSIIASYVGRIFEQGQQRPIYWLAGVRNINIERGDQDIKEVKLSNDILEG